LAQKYQKTVAQICLRWGYQHGFIILPKSKQQGRIIENFNIFDFTLSAEDMSAIDCLTKNNIHTCWDPNSILY
jgi:diketogulonate reductase-like aldo/keto reductase